MSTVFFVLGLFFVAMSLYNLFGTSFKLPDMFKRFGSEHEHAHRLRSFFFALIAFLMFYMAENAA
ncbi:MAG: hypothetical protein AAF441_15125 [Pseudomonadota bacterium]